MRLVWGMRLVWVTGFLVGIAGRIPVLVAAGAVAFLVNVYLAIVLRRRRLAGRPR